MPSVAQNCEPNSSRPPKVEYCINRSTNSSSCEQNVVDNHDRLASDFKIEMGCMDDRSGWPGREIVSVQRDVDVTKHDMAARDLFKRGVEPTGQHGAARVNPDDCQVTLRMLLSNLMGDSDERPLH
jgi:hypothetical protein